MFLLRCMKTLLKTLVGVVVILVTARFLRLSHPLDGHIDFLTEVYSKLDGSVPVPMEATIWTSDIVLSRGYPLEIHEVTTKDGYILRMHRIPHGIKPDSSNNTGKKKVVFLQHGVLASDFVWVTGSNDNALGYVLADQGYDVWMGNSRGNTYSRKHATLDPAQQEYWDFSYDELGRYDLPASVDYILELTGQKKLSYVGYSLGSALFFVAAVENPDFNDKIEAMIGIGPTARVTVLHNIFRFLAPLDCALQLVVKWFEVGLLLPADGLSSRLLQFISSSSRVGTAAIQLVNFSIFGVSDTTDLSLVHVLVGHYPAGGSARTVSQFFENYNSGGKFTRFNHGAEGNLQHYGTEEAPEYNLKLVTAPVYLFYGITDGVATPEDVEWLGSRLGNHQQSFQVGSDRFSHGDFFMSRNASQLLIQPLLKILP